MLSIISKRRWLLLIAGLLLRSCAGGHLNTAFAQNINPGTQIKWPGSCAAGQPYAPNGNTCISIGGTLNPIGAVFQVDQFTGSTFDAQLAACIGGLAGTTGGTCDGRKYAGTVTLAGNIVINVPNVHIYLPCAQISTAYQFIVNTGIRNTYLEGCAFQGGATSGNGGTQWRYTGTLNAFQIGTGFGSDTKGFHMDNVNIDTSSAGSGATGIGFYRVQEIDLRSLYFTGDQSTDQTAIYCNGSANYCGGTFDSITINGYNRGVQGVETDSGTDDGMNAATFLRLHIVCPTSGGSPIAGTYGVDLLTGDGNTWIGGDIESCSTMFHLGSQAQNNTIDGLRNENSTLQYVADTGSKYNSVMTGGTFFTGEVTDAGSRNSFFDAFHRTFNGVNGDWYASQIDATVINHMRLGIGAGNVRGMQWESQVDVGTSSSQYNWLWGLTDGGSGESNWIFQDLINGVIRLQLEEHNTAGNNGTAINGTGTGNVCFQCSGNSGTGGVAFSSGGATPSTVATIDGFGDANFLGTLQVGGVSTFIGSTTVKNQADAEIDATLYAGLTASQKEAFIYKDYTGTSQWFMVKDTANNWALNSNPGAIDAIKAYQSTNSGDLYLDTTNTGGTVRANYETGSGNAFNIYGGTSSILIAQFNAPSGVPALKLPWAAASSGRNCLQIDNSGYVSNTGAKCGTGYKVRLTGQTASIGSQTIITTGNIDNPGTYQINCAASATAATSSPTLTYTLSWTDDSSIARTFTSSAITLNTSGVAPVWTTTTVGVTNATAMTVATTLTGTATYNFACAAVSLD